jgi:hypothetical protein
MVYRGRIAKHIVLILSLAAILIPATFQNVWARKFFSIDVPDVRLELSYGFEDERRTFAADPNTTDRVHDFKQRLLMITQGYVYHPALLKFNISLEPELRQTIEKRDREGSDSDTGNELSMSYDIDATFLAKKPYTLNLFAQRRDSEIKSAFAETTQTEFKSYGGNLQLKYRFLPTTFSYVHASSEQSGFFNLDEDRDEFNLYSSLNTRKSQTTLNANYTETDRTSGGVRGETKTTNGDLRNLYNITGDRRVELKTALAYRNTDSDNQDNTTYNANGNLNWRHTKNFSSNYRAGYSRQEQADDFVSKQAIFGAGLRHQLYENLTTNFQGRATLEDFPGGSRDQYGGNLDLFYTRRIPWGLLNINLAYDLAYVTRQNPEDPIQVVDEPHQLLDSEVTILDNENVETDTIVVTDITNSIIYVENQDYTLEQIDTFTRIIREPLGSIANGQTVLVDYSYIADPSYDDIAFSQSYGIKLSLWSALTLDYRFSRAEQDTVSGTPPPNPTDDTIHRAEARLEWRWSDTRLRFEDIDRSSGVGSTAWLAEEILRFRPWRRLLFTVQGQYGRRELKDTDETTNAYKLRSRADWSIVRWSKLGMEGFYNNVDGDSTKTVQTGLAAELELVFRIWRGRMRYSFSREENKIADQDRRNHYFLVELFRIPF